MSFEAFGSVLPRNSGLTREGHLEIGGWDCVDLGARFGTPLFVLDLDDFRHRLRRYADAFGAQNVHYAAKAFLTKSLVPQIALEGVGLDCASGGELYTALIGSFPPRGIVLHGNNKSVAEIEQAVDAGVARIVVDSELELGRIEDVARERDAEVQVLLRVTPGIEAHTHEYLKTGIEDTKFGVPIGEPALEAAKRVATSDRVKLVGLHSHIGSQIFDLEPFAEAAKVMTRFLTEVRKATGAELPELDLGGGLGIAYLPEDRPPEIEDLAKTLQEAVAAEAEAAGTAPPTIKVEPGRSVVGPAMVTLYEVGTVKEIPGLRGYVSVDGGMSDNIRPMLYDAPYTFVSASRADVPHERELAVSGKLCETGDVLTKSARLPDVEPGELIAVAATGAYCYAMASNYNKQPKPAVVSVSDGRARLLARRETYEDLVRLEE